MTQTVKVYAQALYDLASEERCSQEIGQQLSDLHSGISQEPDFLKLLAMPNLSKQERCGILDECFRGRVHPFVLNFMKILTEKGYMRRFLEFCDAYRSVYNKDNGILEVSAVTAIPLTDDQRTRLKEQLSKVTGKAIDLVCKIDAGCMGGIRLDYDGKRLDGTVQNRLDSISNLLRNTVL